MTCTCYEAGRDPICVVHGFWAGEPQSQVAVATLSFCTRDEHCQAEADQHEPECPVERELLEEFGF